MPLLQFLRPEIDREYVDAVLAFANLDSVEENNLISPGMEAVLRFWDEHQIRHSSDSARPGQKWTVEAIYAEWRSAKEHLVKLLDKIISAGRADELVKRQLSAGVQAIELVGSACFRKGRFEVFVRPKALGLRQLSSAVIALLIEHNLDSHIRKCKECEKYFVGWPGERGKRPQIFCSRPCLDAHKQRAYRARKRMS